MNNVSGIDVPPPGPDTLIGEINNLGGFAGRTEDMSLAQSHGFVSIAGVITQIDIPGAMDTVATAVAWDGTVVGSDYEAVNGVRRRQPWVNP